MRYSPSPSVVERRIRGEHILVPIMGSLEALDSIYTLNETAGLIYSLAASGQDPESIATELVRHFKVERTVAEEDVRRVLRDLTQLGALVEELA